MEEFISLYDYLGKAAGPELGKKVAAAAMKNEIPITARIVETKKYTGEILLYPRWFLVHYFTGAQN